MFYRYELAYNNVMKLFSLFIDSEKGFNALHTLYHSSHKKYSISLRKEGVTFIEYCNQTGSMTLKSLQKIEG